MRDPLPAVGGPYAVLMELVAAMPVALADGSFREMVEGRAGELAEVEAAVAAEGDDRVLERVHGLFGYVGKGYAHGAAGADGACAVPRYLSAGWLAVSDRLRRQPTIDYCDCVLNNWEKVDPAGGMTPENLRLLNRFTGLLDEEWFLKTHVIIESEASGVVAAILDAAAAVRRGDCERLLAMLAWLEQDIAHVASNCLWIMFERQGDDGFLCEPDVFYHRFRPYICTWTALFEGTYVDTNELSRLQAHLHVIST